MSITEVDAWQVMDSRGRPTVAAKVILRSGAQGVAAVPSGASTGTHEAVELRDGGEQWLGLSVNQAVANVRGPLAAAVHGIDAADQERVDAALRAADGTVNLARLGANATLAVSVATAIAAAAAAGAELWQHQQRRPAGSPLLPLPMINIVSGGAHARGLIDIQDVLVIPVGAGSFAEAIRWGFEIRETSARLARKLGSESGFVADEGGISARFASNREAVELVYEAIAGTGLTPGTQVALALDVAATNFYTDHGYHWESEQRTLSAAQLVDELVAWAADFPIVSIEDPVAEDDWDAWAYATQQLPVPQLVGDDLLVTNAERLGRALAAGVASSVLVKPNQIGTLSAAREVLELAQAAGYSTVLSARSGETEDAWLADLAVGWRAGQIKVGSTSRSERTAKWNRLLRIEHENPDSQLAPFPGRVLSAEARGARNMEILRTGND